MEPSIKTLCATLSAEFWRHCMLNSGSQRPLRHDWPQFYHSCLQVCAESMRQGILTLGSLSVFYYAGKSCLPALKLLCFAI